MYSIVHCSTIDDRIHVSLSILVSSGYKPRSDIAGSCGSFNPNFLRNLSIPSCIVVVSIYIPTNSATVFPFFLHPSPAFIVCRLFHGGHSDQCEVIAHSSFDLHFSKNE